MPEREKAVCDMARTLTGAPYRRFDDRREACPEGVDPLEWERSRALAEKLYVDLVETIDFTRVLIEAQGRHLSVHPDKGVLLASAGIGDAFTTSICPECITEVLLAQETRPSWDVQSESPRYVLHQVEPLEVIVPDDLEFPEDDPLYQ